MSLYNDTKKQLKKLTEKETRDKLINSTKAFIDDNVKDIAKDVDKLSVKAKNTTDQVKATLKRKERVLKLQTAITTVETEQNRYITEGRLKMDNLVGLGELRPIWDAPTEATDVFETYLYNLHYNLHEELLTMKRHNLDSSEIPALAETAKRIFTKNLAVIENIYLLDIKDGPARYRVEFNIDNGLSLVMYKTDQHDLTTLVFEFEYINDHVNAFVQNEKALRKLKHYLDVAERVVDITTAVLVKKSTVEDIFKNTNIHILDSHIYHSDKRQFETCELYVGDKIYVKDLWRERDLKDFEELLK